MSMTVSEAAESASDVATKLRAIGLPVWGDILVDSIAVLRTHIEREVDEAMVERACTSHYDDWASINPSLRISLRRDMKAALIAALGEK